MPELPEVETTRRGIAPHLIGRRITSVVLRRPDLRWPIPPEIGELLPGQRIEDVERRAKYLLLQHSFESEGMLRVEFKTDAANLGRTTSWSYFRVTS